MIVEIFPEDMHMTHAHSKEHALVEQLRLACSVALGDLLAFGMPRGVSTDKLLQAALAAAEEYLVQMDAAEGAS